uniref:UBP-type domain-containing protein n=1 Tax=Meloidogyne javanica TaxID=6303 RepID=A0A915LGB8_MELJA
MNEEDLLIELKKYISEGSFKLKWPQSADKVYKDECFYCSDTAFSPGGLFISLLDFVGICAKHLDLYVEKTSFRLFLNIKKSKVPNEDSEEPKDKRLCISQTEDKISSDYNLCLHPHIEVPIKIESHIGDRLHEFVDMVIAHINTELQQRLQSGVSEWDGEERQISKAAEKLEQIPFEGKISYDGWICAKPGCELKEDLWLNLSDGVIMCGRYAPMSGVKGNGHAKTHYEETGYPLVVKLDTIADGDGDIYSYSEDALVRDPLLGKHLAHFGLSIDKFKTEETTLVGSKRELPFRAHNYLAKNKIKSLFKNRKNIKKRGIDDFDVFKKNAEVFKKNISKMLEQLEEPDFGCDLNSVNDLQTKHEIVEKNLDVLEDGIYDLHQEVNSLQQKYPDVAEQIEELQNQLNDQLLTVTQKAKMRKDKLLENYDYLRFLDGFRNIIQWIDGMVNSFSSDELADNVAGAEALLERHQSYLKEITSKEIKFKSLRQLANQLINYENYSSDAIRIRMVDARKRLNDAVVHRRKILDQCLELQLFYCDCEQCDTWMNAREAFLAQEDPTGDNVESLIKKHEDFDKAIASQQEKLNNLDQLAKQLVASEHYAKQAINTKREQIFDRWDRLKERLIEKRSKLGESQTLLQFYRDVDEVENWISEKFQIAQKVDYSELSANADRIAIIISTGQNLISVAKCVEVEDAVSKRLNVLNDQWELLVETLLRSKDTDCDLPSIENLLKKHQLLEADINAHADRVANVNGQAEALMEADQFYKDSIETRRQGITERYANVKDMAKQRRENLNKAITVHQFLIDIDDEESWIKLKKLLVSSDDYGRDLTGVQNLNGKHRRLDIELASHQAQVQNLRSKALELLQASEVRAPEILKRIQVSLNEKYKEIYFFLFKGTRR